MSKTTSATATVLEIAEAVDRSYFKAHPAAKILHRSIIFGEDGCVGNSSMDAFMEFSKHTILVVKLDSGELFRWTIRPECEVDDLTRALREAYIT